MTLDGSYPAMPMDCGNLSTAFKESQYTGVTLSMPSLIPTKMSVGVKVPSSAIAMRLYVSLYISAPSPLM